MLSAPHADRAWKAMARSIKDQDAPDGDRTPRPAGQAAYAALLRGEGVRAEGDRSAEPWLLLRSRGRSNSQ